jgi:hypothetical protein
MTTVAITGHRPNRILIRDKRLTRRLREVLKEVRRATRAARAGGDPPRAISALAEGADRMFAAAALDLGFSLDVLLPFARADYETTFGDESTTCGYRALLAEASSVTELPGSLADTKAAYEAVGRATVDGADLLVAVWDGKPSAGRGGTPEIVEYAISRAIPVVWIAAGQDRPPLLLSLAADTRSARFVLGSTPVRSVPLEPHAVARLTTSILTLNSTVEAP